jgi:hypothetical protein
MSMNHEKMFTICAILGTASCLILGNIVVPSYALLNRAGQSQVNADPGIDKQVLKGVALILKGVNTILMGKTSGGLDEVSLGANMIRTSCSCPHQSVIMFILLNLYDVLTSSPIK